MAQGEPESQEMVVNNVYGKLPLFFWGGGNVPKSKQSYWKSLLLSARAVSQNLL